MGTEPQAVTNGAALAAVEREREWWESLLAEVGEARMTEPGTVGDWSFKDLVAHLFAWEAREMDRFEAALAGRPDPAALVGTERSHKAHVSRAPSVHGLGWIGQRP